MPLTIERPPDTIREETPSDAGNDLGTHGVKIFNNEVTSFDEVIWILMLATQCGTDEATLEANEAHARGWAFVHWASLEECQKVASIIETVRVRTEIVEG